MNDSNPGLGIHLTQETDLRGQAIRQAGIDNAAGDASPKSTALGDASGQTNPLMYLAGLGVGWLGRKGLAKAWKYLAKPVVEEIGQLSVVKSARALWEEYKPGKLWERAKNTVLAQKPFHETGAESSFDTANAGRLAEKSSAESMTKLSTAVAGDTRIVPPSLPSLPEPTLDSAKVVTEKTGVKVAEEGLVKAGAETAGKAVGKSLLKKVPILGVAAGATFAWGRAREGDWLGAAGEMASGIASCFPGIGTGISVAIDAGLAGRDIYYSGSPQAQRSLVPEVAAPAVGAMGPPLVATNQLQPRPVASPMTMSRLRRLHRPSIDPSYLVPSQPAMAVGPDRAPALG